MMKHVCSTAKYQCLGMLFLLTILFGCHPSKQSQKTETATTATATEAKLPTSTLPTDAPLPEKSVTAADAEQRGTAYLSRVAWSMESTYLYTYLQPQFGWPDIPAQARTPMVRDSLKRRDDANARTILHEMALFERLLDPQARITAAQLSTAEETDSITVPALYCDQFPIDTAVFFPVLRGESAASGYRATHALLCLVWLQKYRCFPPATLSGLHKNITQSVRGIVLSTPDYWSDLNLEAAALLRAAGESIPKDWVRGVVAAQKPDGGWGIFPTDARSDAHATILALWLLGGSQ